MKHNGLACGFCGGDTLPAIAAQRHIGPASLRLLVRGELDWIVMKCLEKDRNRRYETAASLAADVERFLNDEPVQACPPSTWYRFSKFARRNRREVLIAGAAAAVGVMGVAGLAVSRALIARAKEDLRLEVYFQRITVAHREFVLTFHGHAGVVTSLAFSPDGNRLYSGSRDTKVEVSDMSRLRDAPDEYRPGERP